MGGTTPASELALIRGTRGAIERRSSRDRDRAEIKRSTHLHREAAGHDDGRVERREAILVHTEAASSASTSELLRVEWSSVVISGWQWLSVLSSAHQCSSVVSSAHQCSSVLISAHQCSSVIISAHQCSSVLISGKATCWSSSTSRCMISRWRRRRFSSSSSLLRCSSARTCGKCPGRRGEHDVGYRDVGMGG